MHPTLAVRFQLPAYEEVFSAQFYKGQQTTVAETYDHE